MNAPRAWQRQDYVFSELVSHQDGKATMPSALRALAHFNVTPSLSCSGTRSVS